MRWCARSSAAGPSCGLRGPRTSCVSTQVRESRSDLKPRIFAAHTPLSLKRALIFSRLSVMMGRQRPRLRQRQTHWPCEWPT